MIDEQNPFEDRINVTTLQCVVRYKLHIEDPKAKLDFEFSDDNRTIFVKVNGAVLLIGKLHNGYDDKYMRSLDLVESLARVDTKEYLPSTHQTHLLAKLFATPLLILATSTQ
jgi:hypothetical protein